jgi:hypothetical protein
MIYIMEIFNTNYEKQAVVVAPPNMYELWSKE